MGLAKLSFVLSWLLSYVVADLTIQYLPQATMVATGAHNTTGPQPPPLPNPMPNLAPFIQLNKAPPAGVSIKLPSAFLGFSIEISVANQVLGHNSSLIEPTMLNLLHNIAQRSGTVNVRVGGNTQDHATVDEAGTHPELDRKILWKDHANANSNNPTATPPVYLSRDFFYLLSNISALTDVHWYLGIPFNDTNWRLGIAPMGPEILGDRLLGFQTANEPDFYVSHKHRVAPYGPQEWMTELRSLVNAMNDPKYDWARKSFIVPSIAGADGWDLQAIWDMGLVPQFNDNIKYLAVEHYPADNCAAIWGGGTIRNPQDEMVNYANHDTYLKSIVKGYAPHTAYAQTVNRGFIMFETNTASCGGFQGVSNSFGAALWGLDYAMQMAHTNFTGAMYHVGGQTTFYNPFTAPPTNEKVFHQWTIGSMYYSALVMAEVMGMTNTTQIMDLDANNANPQTPAYVLYENGQVSKLGIFNYMDKSKGSADLTVTFAIGGSGVGAENGTPATVKVKYLESNSITDTVNFTWAGQTLGDAYGSDGLLKGDEVIKTIECNNDNTCTIPVPAPAFALVFLNGDPNSNVAYPSSTYTTTAITQTRNTATMDPAVLATSNGHKNIAAKKYSTSFGSGNKNGAERGVGALRWFAVGLSVGIGFFVAAI
ncbi:glycoside hydrolase family 79 protein [Flagelloscypha sp. PMI_526]|nr:glycoside hydrolase family 79 protein [Flagelloscypha sp. PMI_526]